MNLFVFDTDPLSLLERHQLIVETRLRAQNPQELAVAVITVEEQMVGRLARIRQARGPERIALAYHRLALMTEALRPLRILRFTEAAIVRYEALKRLKLSVGGNDLRIAAIALENNAIVVTRNVRDFERVPGLTIENWAD